MNSNSQSVTIVPDEQGNAIRVSKTNAEYAHIRLKHVCKRRKL